MYYLYSFHIPNLYIIHVYIYLYLCILYTEKVDIYTRNIIYKIYTIL